jgi:hypothetical protein
MNETPLSDLMDEAFKGNSKSYKRFVEAFYRSEVGVIASNVPENTYGKIVSTEERPLRVGLSEYHGGKYILVCADFFVYNKRYGGAFDGTMSGEDAFKTVLASSDLAGIQINSAKSEMSLLIDRDTIENYTQPALPFFLRWWQFWRRK